MRGYGDTESVNLSTGEHRRRVVGNGESRLMTDRELFHRPNENDLTSPWDYQRYRESFLAAYGYYPKHDPAHDYLLDEANEVNHDRKGFDRHPEKDQGR